MGLVVFILVVVFGSLLYSFAYFKLFDKAGENKSMAFIPVYNYIIHLKIIGKPLWWAVLLFIPVVHFFIYISMTVELLKSFGKTKLYQMVLGVIAGPFYFTYISFKEDVKYLGKASELPKQEKSPSKEWSEAILFAVFAATFIRWILMEAFTIPTPSMERSLLVGDFLFVSKMHYGARTPKTPLQFPLTHQDFWGSGIPSYVDWIQLPQYRLPGFTDVKRNDVVVFNYPMEDQYPTDLKTNYIKRCVAVGGDTLKVESTQVYINGEPLENPELMQFNYYVQTDESINERIFKKYHISEYGRVGNGYTIFTTPKVAEELRSLKFVKQVILQQADKDYTSPGGIFPNPNDFGKNGDFFGPIVVPKKGATFTVNKKNLAMYKRVLTHYEGFDEGDVKVSDTELFIDGKKVDSYTFQQNYYFMMGDNRHNSLDSRYWGFVPEDHVVGKAFFIWLSLDANESFLKKIRWDRFLNRIE